MHQATEKIIAFNAPRLPEMVKIKYALMQKSLFRFYRGTCHLYYDMLVADPDFPTGPLGWTCGDLHLENFGSYRSDNDQIYFDLNDFDEAILAPVTWEIARLMTSIFIGFESLEIEEAKAKKMAKLFLKSYTDTLKTGKPDYVESAMARGIVCDFLSAVAARKQKNILAKRTSFKKGRLQIVVKDPKHYKVKKPLRQELFDHVDAWLKVDEHSPYNYKAVDVVFRLAGTGSVGLERYLFLLKSSNKTGFKYLLLDMKEATTSSLSPFVNSAQPDWPSQADRVIAIQRRMQNRCPALLSTSIFKGKSFIMQEMQPTKDSIDFRLLRDRYRDMYSVIDTMAMLTASSQLRSSGQDGSAITDDLKAFALDENWQQKLLDAAERYSRQIKIHYQEFLADLGHLSTPPAKTRSKVS